MKAQAVTHGIVHACFRGFRRFVARKKSLCNLIFSPRNPARHHTINR